MKRRILSLLLILSLVWAWPGLAETGYTSRLSLLHATDAQLENILLAAEALDGFEVDYGESFSFNEVVGPRTRARGFVIAENGRGVKVTGGGVAQAATALYLALLKLPGGIRFDELNTYGARFVGDYVEDGSQAVITDYAGGTDFSFTNRASDLTIEMWVSGNSLNCTVTTDDDDWFGGDRRTLSARIPWGSDRDLRNNIELAAESVYDTTLSEDDAFSFNEVVGPRTESYGYVGAVNGRGVRVIGGGVAQVASAIWLAIKNDDDFEILERSTYGSRYNQDYVENAADAIVTDYKNGADFAFRYTGDGTATLYTYLEGDDLRCDVVVSD